jgi:hypothetical protein
MTEEDRGFLAQEAQVLDGQRQAEAEINRLTNDVKSLAAEVEKWKSEYGKLVEAIQLIELARTSGILGYDTRCVVCGAFLSHTATCAFYALTKTIDRL